MIGRIFVLGLWLAAGAAAAQGTVYRCGNEYSLAPCVQGKAVETQSSARSEAQLGSAGFWRLRIGIGHPGVKAEVVNYVLRKPSAEHREAIEKSIEQALGALDLVLAGDMERAMMKVHAKPPRPKPAPAPDRPAVARPDGPAGETA